ELEHLGDAVRHAGRERVLGVVREVEQPGRLVPALEDLLDHGRVVPAAGGGSAVRGARHPGLVEVAPQAFRLRIRHHRDIGRLVEIQDPARNAPLVCAARGELDEHVVQPAQLGRLRDAPAPAVGGVQHVLLELRLQLGELEHRGLEALLTLGREPDSGEAEVPHRMLDHLALHRGERRAFLIGDGAIGVEQRLALREVGLVGGQERQAGVVAAAERVGVLHRVQVTHRRPGARHAMLQLLERLDERREGREGERGELLDARAVLGEYLAHRRLDVLGAGLVEAGRVGGTCVSVGCVPKKISWYAAELGGALNDAPDYGFRLEVAGHDWATLRERRDAYVLRLNEIYAANLAKRKVELLRGAGRFVDARSVAAAGRVLTADHIVIATGGHPRPPAMPGAELGITSDGFFELASRPERVAVVGSSYIAIELSGVFAGLGADTELVLRGDTALKTFDVMLGEEALG